jgi:hypothetical protein
LPIDSTRFSIFTVRQIGEAAIRIRRSLQLGFRQKESRGCAMQAIGYAERYVIAREKNVVVVDFRRPDPPAPHFPGAGALRAAALDQSAARSCSFEDSPSRQRLLA